MIALAIVVAFVAGAVVLLRRSDDAAKPAATATERPNIVMIMTDDQTVESMRVMPEVNALIAAKGVSFADNIVSYPLCCPSRATYLTGQYAHNTGVRGTVPPWGGYGVFHHQETTFPAALQKAGYDTIHIGKYLNGYRAAPPVRVPPGWSDWHGSIDPTTYEYFGYTLFENGKRKTYAKKDSDYQTDVYTDLATSVIRGHEGSDAPYFLNVAYLAPHAQVDSTAPDADSDALHIPVAAPRDAGRYAGEPLPESTAFDEADVSDKPRWVQSLPRITDERRAEITKDYDAYLESLLAVDDGVERIITALKETNELDHTVVMFTSDNGFFFGEHRVDAGKERFYEPSIRVPLLMRGPGIAAGAKRRSLVANIDLAPTILDLAGAKPLRTMDGTSLAPLLHAAAKPQARAILLESGGPYRPDFGLRTSRYAYFENNTGEHELYDLQTDPDELVNRAGDPALAPVEADLAGRLEALKQCAGPTCRGGG